MQQHDNNKILYSASDLITFLGCRHASVLDTKALDEDMKAAKADAAARLLQQKGFEHEAACLRKLQEEGNRVVEITRDRDLRKRSTHTLEVMKSGVDVIYQATFFDTTWRGDADFLIKSDTPSSLGDFSYEVMDAKLARNAEPKHVMQLCVYSDLLTKLQNLRPTNIHLFTGDGEKHSFRIDDFFHYYTRTKSRFESFVQNPPSQSYPEPCSHCKFCRWRESCSSRWEKDDHLGLVAGLQRPQADKLRKTGINTVAKLAATAPDRKIPHLNNQVFQRLRSQAILQHHKATTGENKYELIASPLGKGLARMPEPDKGDLFFDMEGDPLYPDGLEYLFGVYFHRDNEKIFKPFWAHNHQEEKATFQRFMAFLAEHLGEHPTAHIYHYNHYETTAMKRLACRYAICEEQMDNLLRSHKFVDLYQVVRESIRTSEPGYSIKNLETFYMEKRTETVATAEDSIIFYNEWRETGKNDLLKKIADYNEVDCISTHLLQQWLLKLRPDNIPWFKSDSKEEEEGELQRKDWEIEYEDYKNRLGDDNELLSFLLEFHNREAKSQWWIFFERQNKFEEELIEDAECLGGLNQVAVPYPEKRSLVYTYSFPPQTYKLKANTPVKDTATTEGAGTIIEIDEKQGIVKIRCGKALPEELSIGPTGPTPTKVIRESIYRYADHVLKEPDKPHAATELLMRNIPRIQGREPGKTIAPSDTLETILALDHSYLFIQGPPGAGKTYTSSHIILDLIRRGKKVGITSNSHKAIDNLLGKVAALAIEKGVHFQGIKKITGKDNAPSFPGDMIRTEKTTKKMELEADLFAGTAWVFSDKHFHEHLDYLFVDEAGQVATANIVAMSNATKNTILVGDQMQLGQPTQGTHPGEAGLSVLEFLLGERSTIPPERGVFLGESRRMCPSICQFISDAFYDGRLAAHESTSERGLNLKNTDLPNEGIVTIPVHHEGRSQKSEEEGEVIKNRYQSLLGQSFSDGVRGTRTITQDDILVVSPYNVQVNYLRSLLPEGARVGTVDKFQGQEAPIVLISMVTSDAENLSRNMDFLYSKNRLNVAISRAQCLAVMVFNPKLSEAPCKTLEQIRLVNTFCHLEEYARQIPSG